MLSQQDNQLLTRVGPGTPMGELMRRYWIPAAFSQHIAQPDSPPVRVRLLGENLVLFRDTQGRIGLLDERCPHRTASLFYGRNEENGLRCVYHGLKFDVDGKCVDLPCVPQGSDAQKANIAAQLKAKSYPCLERGDGPARAQAGISGARNGPSSRHPSATPPATSRNATGFRHSKAALTRRISLFCMAAAPNPVVGSSRRCTRSSRRISASWSAPAAIPALATSCGT